MQTTYVRLAMSVIEVILVLAIVAVLIGLVVPAVQRVRELAERTKCVNNMKQLTVALQNYANNRRGGLPHLIVNDVAVPGKTGIPFVSVFPALLEELEGSAILEDVAFGRNLDRPLYQFLCPSDPTTTHPYHQQISYAANGQVFLAPDPTRKLSILFADGTANTIVFGEHYSRLYHANGAVRVSYNWLQTRNDPPYKGPNGIVYIRLTSFAAVENLAQYKADLDDVYPVTMGVPRVSVGSVRGLTFQVRPNPVEADMRICHTPHAAGMVSGFADGHVRVLKGGMAEEVFWALVTPAGGEIVTLEE